MSAARRRFLQVSAATALSSGLAAGHPARADEADDEARRPLAGPRGGLLFTCSNLSEGNEVLVYSADPAGRLQLRQRAATQGRGSGRGLGSQGALVLSGCGRFLFVVNAGSDSVSSFRLGTRGLRLTSVVASGGNGPISVAENGGLVYVLNAGGAGGVSGFVNLRGRLIPIANSARGLSASGGTAPAQVGLSDDGDTLVVAERATNRLTSYEVRDDGSLGAPQPNASAGMTPFGFAVDRRGTLIVSEAFGGAVNASTVSSYRFADAAPQTPVVISARVPLQQSAACWVALTPNGRFAYVANTASGSISLLSIASDGSLSLLKAAAASAAGSGPLDLAVSANGRLLFALNGGNQSLAAYRVGADGSLSPAASLSGLPAATTGLAAS